ncbi:hypothetical protein [Niabella hibiscisoli]|uniref:hypothetical protein n=1 Tax=Niabella hibiscisoli TaxID=1825928 RepID=UPI001F0CFE40|nr:hypothetical protein [Niabella hibiscisoli]MCH5720088.1 hypothetical protein [Niabella hibiscisoli]
MIFSFRDNKIIEDSYSSCPLVFMKKQIFKRDNGLKIDSTLEMDDQFNEAYTEVVSLNDGSQMIASLSGCEDLDLYFSRTIPYKAALKTNQIAIKEELLKNLQYLKNNTLFKTIIQHGISQLSVLETNRVTIDKNGGLHYI